VHAPTLARRAQCVPTLSRCMRFFRADTSHVVARTHTRTQVLVNIREARAARPCVSFPCVLCVCMR
jgi:hypothetical protein